MDSNPVRLVLFVLASHLLAAHRSVAMVDGDPGGGGGPRRFFPSLPSMFTRRPTTVQEPQMCDCTCGERNFGSRIVGGVPTEPNEFPWIVRLSYFNRFYCGGMLINDRYVLTAAHCVKGFMWFMIKVTLGEHDRCDTSRPRAETRFVLRAITGDFSYLNFDNDVALLRLNDRVPIAQTIRPICLPRDHGELYVGKTAIASGWGTLKEDGKPACVLQEVDVPVMSNDQCKATNYNEQMISDNMICAGYADGGKDSCQGDSGGPLIRETDDKRYELIGVVSWGNGCARPGFPGIYTRVTRYLDWIKSNAAGGCWCHDTPPPTTPATVAPDEHHHKQTTEKQEVTTEKQDVTTEKLEVTTEKLDVTTEKQELTSEKQEVTSEKQEVTSEKQEVMTEKQDVTSEKQEVTSEKQEVTSEKQEVTTEKQEVMTETQDVTSEKQEVTSEKQEVMTEKQEMMTEKQDVLSEKQKVTTEKQEVMTEKQDVTLEKQEVTSEKQEVTSENSEKQEVGTENYEGITDDVEVVIENHEVAMDTLEVTTDTLEEVMETREVASETHMEYKEPNGVESTMESTRERTTAHVINRLDYTTLEESNQ